MREAVLVPDDHLVFAGLWRRPVGVWFHAFVGVAAGIALLALSAPLPDVPTFAMAAGLLVVAAMVWFGRFVAYAFAAAHGRADGRSWWFAVAPIGAVIFAVLAWAHVPLLVRFELSKPAFRRAAGAVSTPSRVGLYRVHDRRSSGAGTLFETDDGFLFSRGGIAYLPDGVAGDGITVVRHIEGDWYVWKDEYAD